MTSLTRWKALYEQDRAARDTMQSKMQSYYDDCSEAWQEGERGEAFQEVLNWVEEARTAVEDLSLE